jgi:hypothetical protein
MFMPTRAASTPGALAKAGYDRTPGNSSIRPNSSGVYYPEHMEQRTNHFRSTRERSVSPVSYSDFPAFSISPDFNRGNMESRLEHLRFDSDNEEDTNDFLLGALPKSSVRFRQSNISPRQLTNIPIGPTTNMPVGPPGVMRPLMRPLATPMNAVGSQEDMIMLAMVCSPCCVVLF